MENEEILPLLAARKGWAVIADFKNVVGGWTIRLQTQTGDPEGVRSFIADYRREAEAEARAFLDPLPERPGRESMTF